MTHQKQIQILDLAEDRHRHMVKIVLYDTNTTFVVNRASTTNTYTKQSYTITETYQWMLVVNTPLAKKVYVPNINIMKCLVHIQISIQLSQSNLNWMLIVLVILIYKDILYWVTPRCIISTSQSQIEELIWSWGKTKIPNTHRELLYDLSAYLTV